MNNYFINDEMSEKITVVIPAYNEEKTIKDIINTSKKHCDNILVVLSKKSKDRTKSILESVGVDYILDHGKGKGEALRCAINYIKEGILIFIDSDGSHDPNDIPKLVRPIIENNADMVIGSRMTGGSDELHGTLEEFFRLMFSSIINLIINYRFGAHITDYQNGFRAIRVSTAKRLKLKENITTIEQEIGIKCLKKGFRISEVPAHEYKRKFGKSTFNVWKVGYKYLWQIVRDIL